ncbi:aromatic acid exporter family protein [Paenibacillus cellulositrophicus]|uniref:FUSC family protein n=1 Tax=Paenibacillus cellulositrophicus TaxID=562959 RepID=UPI00203D13B5|nr:FUSC family protein [Paenibacillus cellulositrophicus]MCM2997149.1 aromatic acid exporter family protein [Paenibacillus cellulositrophicus]
MSNNLWNTIKNSGVVWKMPLAAALSWEAAKWAGSSHPYLAPLTAILSVQATVSQSMQFAWQRVLGTVAGVLLTLCVTPWLPLNGWSIGASLLIAAFAIQRLKLDHTMVTQVALSILLVLFFQHKMPSYSLDRIRDTIIGAVLAVLVQALLFPPDSIPSAKQKMTRFADHLASHFIKAGQWVEKGCPPSEAQTLKWTWQALFQELHQATTELDKAAQSLRYHPFATKKRDLLNRLTRQMEQLRSGYANLSDMIRVLGQWSRTGHFTREHQQQWAAHLQELAQVIKRWHTGPDISTDGSAGKVSLSLQAPAHWEQEQYPLALYMNAGQLLQDFGGESAFSLSRSSP